jgi:protein-tyrosine kinase
MNGLLQRDERRIFIFDSPPLLLSTEASALAEVAGQTVLVVRAEHTEQHALQDALSRLPEGCSPSLVLNQSTQNARGYYYYGYGVQEGSDADPGEG